MRISSEVNIVVIANTSPTCIPTVPRTWSTIFIASYRKRISKGLRKVNKIGYKTFHLRRLWFSILRSVHARQIFPQSRI